MKQMNDELIKEIEEKRVLFTNIQEYTLNFLRKMQSTYLVDFVVKKMNIDENSKINEQNVIDYLAEVYCFIQLINDFNENVENRRLLKEDLSKSISTNKSIESLQKEIKMKLSRFNYDNCLHRVKKDSKQ